MYDSQLQISYSSSSFFALEFNPFFTFSQGGEDQIRAKFYSIAFRQVYEEDDSTVRWEIADYELAGDTPYL